MNELVLLHGWGMHGGIWGEFAQQLQALAPVHCWDLPGYGGTAPLEPCDLDTLSAALLPRLPENAVLIGWSLGGMVALRLARLAPQNVRAVVLISSSARFCASEDWPCAMAPAVLTMFEKQMRGDAAETLHRFLAVQSLGGDDARAQVAQLKRRLAERPWPSEQTLRDGLAMLRHGDIRSELAEIRQPVCVIQGDKDNVVPVAAAAALQALLPQSEVHIIDNCAHAPFQSYPDTLLSIIRSFLSRHEGRAAKARPDSVRRAFEQAAASYDSAAVVQRAIADRLAQQLPECWPEQGVQRVLDVGSGTGYGEQCLRPFLGTALLWELDLAHSMLKTAQAQPGRGACVAVCANAARIPLAQDVMDFLWSSLALQWAEDLQATGRELWRVLKPGGVLHFATLLPGTLSELAESFAGVDQYRHVNQFLSAEDVQRDLRQAGFEIQRCVAEPYVAHYPSVADVLRSLKAIGAQRVVAQGVPGLMGKQRWQHAVNNYEARRQPEGLPATYQVLYVSAKKPMA